MLAIPSFYKRRTTASPNDPNQQLASLRRSEARNRFLEEKRREINVNEDEMKAFWVQLYAYSEPPKDGPSDSLRGRTLTRSAFLSFAKVDILNPRLKERLFTEETYSFFPKNLEGNVYAWTVHRYVKETIEYMKIRCDFCIADENDTGHLTEMELAKYLDKFVPKVVVDQGQNKVYLAVLMRKFLFFLEQNHQVSIRNLLNSPILTEFKYREKNERSWFNHANILRLIELFVMLNPQGQKDLMLTKEMMLRFNLETGADFPPRITSAVVDRLFAVKASPTGSNPAGVLDFREFLNYVLAFQSKNNEVSVRYFWEILDSSRRGFLDSHDVNELVSCVFDTVGRETLFSIVGTIHVSDVVNEIFDMATGGKSIYLTLDDLNRSGHGSTILNMLSDPYAFIDYEQRETRLSSQSQQQLQQELDQAWAGEQQDASSRIFTPLREAEVAITNTAIGYEGQVTRGVEEQETQADDFEEKAEFYSAV